MRTLYIAIFLPVLLFACSTSFAQGKPQDTMLHVTLKPVKITGEREWANDTIQYRYNQMKYYVTTILPYLDEAVLLYNELEQETSADDISKKERKAFVKQKEEELKQKFDDNIKNLNETQGMLLVKLIARQTGENIYDMLQEFRNPLAAMKWQAWARLNGFNLNKRYDPADEPWLEHIMEGLGYPLPAVYQREILTAN